MLLLCSSIPRSAFLRLSGARQKCPEVLVQRWNLTQKLHRTLEQQGLKKMDTNNASFDTDYHEAVALFPTDEAEKKNHVIDCVQTGYLLNDKVLRHAKVVVGQ